MVGHWVHDPETDGSIPPPATNLYGMMGLCPIKIKKPKQPMLETGEKPTQSKPERHVNVGENDKQNGLGRLRMFLALTVVKDIIML